MKVKRLLLLLGLWSTILTNHHIVGMSQKPAPSEEFWEALKGQTPADLATVKRLYKQFNLNAEDETFGMTPLMYATYSGEVELVRLFLSGGADVNMKSEKSGFTALMYVTGFGGQRPYNQALAKLLIDAGADPNVRAHNGFTAMKMAAGQDSRLVPLLIKAGADASSRDDALFLVIGDGRFDLIALLADNTDYSLKTLQYTKRAGKPGDKKVLTIAAQKNVARKVLQEAQGRGISAGNVQNIIKKQFGGG
jgi:hypothetical protein